MTSFKEFLEKEKVDFTETIFSKNEGILVGIVQTIKVKALGEWAWSKITLEEKQWLCSKLYWNDWDFDLKIDEPVIEIAIACLGEAEVKKRLEEL